MSAQKDIVSGYNFAPNAQATQEQLEQAINGAAPLSNIGFVYVGTVRPDITNNPRFIRYFWLDITDPAAPILKRYIENRTVLVDADPSWAAVGVATGSILTSMLATRSTTGGVNVDRLKAESDYSDGGNQYQVLRVAANGKDIEVVSLDTALADSGGIDLARLDTAGTGTGKYLKNVAGALDYGYIDPSVDITSSINNRISAPTSIAPSNPNEILCTNNAGTAAEWKSVDDALGAGNVDLSALSILGASPNDIIRFNGTVWAKVTPSLRMVAGDTINSGIVVGAMGVATAFTQAHGLVTVPKLIRVVAHCDTADGVYVANDEVDVLGLRVAASSFPAASICADVTNIVVSLASAAGLQIADKVGAGYSAMTEANWSIKIYAWK